MHDRGMFDWGYHTEPEPHLDGRRIEAMRGKVLGGSSSINVMAFTRGTRATTTAGRRRARSAGPMRTCCPISSAARRWQDGESEWRGGSGPIGVEWAKTRDPLYDAWIAAAQAVGIPHTGDYNGGQPEGFGRSQYSIRNGRRSSAATAYLKPALARPNLALEVSAHATRVLLNGARATGIEYMQDGNVRRAEAAREVILCLGAFNTPQLLMRSGIGPADHLRRMDVGPVVDLPVGSNLQDHMAVMIAFTRPRAGSFHREMRADRMALSMLRAYLFGSGPATVVPGGLHAFVKTRRELAVPDIEFMFRGARRQCPSVVSAAAPRLSRRLRHPPDLAASGQPRRGALALG